MSPYEKRTLPWLARGLGILLILSLLAALLPWSALAAPATATKCATTYEVKRGDTLAKIGNRFGYAANQIVYVNKNWVKPYTIYVGQRICIPEKKSKEAPKLDSKYANAVAAHFAAGRTADSVLIYTFTYPATTVIVKVADASDASYKYTNVGTINIAAVGNNRSFKFKLPSALKNASKIRVCLKDRTTSYLQCVYPRTGS